MSGMITSKDGVEDLFKSAMGDDAPPEKLVERPAPTQAPISTGVPMTPTHVLTIPKGPPKPPERVVLPPYDGPRLEPPRFISGWCLHSVPLRHHIACKVWYSSPGSKQEYKYNDQIPCTCECHREYLDTVFGPGWERPDGKRVGHSLREVMASGTVGERLPEPGSHTNMEVEVSDTSFPEGVGTVAVEVPAEVPAPAFSDAPIADEVTEDGRTVTEVEADENAEESRPAESEAPAEDKPKRAPRTDLEPEVKKVTDAFVTGSITLGEGEFLTPHRIGKYVQQNLGSEKAPSTGAVSAVLDRWAGIGFATLVEKPKAFGDYTDAGREKGLSALKAEAVAARKAAKASA